MRLQSRSPTRSSSFRATRSAPYTSGDVQRLVPEGESSDKVVTGWLPAGAHFAMAFSTMSADLLERSSNRSPEQAVLFYVADDYRAGEDGSKLRAGAA
jgi:8-hydroxy-5-deazaflavin:NADPH oxidoreductase